MSQDPYESDEWAAFARQVKAGLVPKMQDSTVVMSLVPEEGTDVKFAVELGYAIMLDKPIIAMVLPGTKIPPKLLMVADDIIEIDIARDPEKASASINEALERMDASGKFEPHDG